MLLLNLHRIVTDERSAELFAQELALCYEAFKSSLHGYTGQTDVVVDAGVQPSLF